MPDAKTAERPVAPPRADDPAIPGLQPSTLPLRAGETDIRAAVEAAGLIPLLLSVVHITGRLDILDEAGPTERPQHSTDLSGSIPPERAAKLRERAAEAIIAWRDRGCPPAYRPHEAEFVRMIDWMAGKALEPGYAPLLAEELGFDGDERAFHWSGPVSEADRARVPVIVVGAGLSGLVMGYRLKEAGLPFLIVEKNPGPGGTWFENRYPGARVDVPSHCYSFSFVRDQRWPELFSPSPVLRDYFAGMADRLGLTPHIRYETEVARASWDEEGRDWTVVLRGKAGEETRRAKAIVSAVGQLNRPLIPHVEGEDTFKGVRTHTSRWPDGLEVKGKRVVVIGTAATALQLVPELAREAAGLTVFQRSPTWVLVHPEYRRAVSAGEQWCIDHLPGYARWYRLILYNWAGDGTPAHMIMDPAWSGGPQAVSEANEASRVRLTKGMAEAIGTRTDLLDKLIPKYPPYVKRPNVGDGGFFKAFQRDNVRLCTEGVVRFTEDGVVDGAGVRHPADIVVYATGFRALEYLAPMEVVGRGGHRINDYWGEEPRAYLGVTVPDFPNLFLMYGPGTNLGFNGNLFFNGECQARYIMGCLKWLVEDHRDTVELKPEVYANYAERMDKALANFTWSHGGAGSWYKNKAGKVIANSPWPLLTYWEWTRAPNADDYTTAPAMAEA